jgi:hypothetical protein
VDREVSRALAELEQKLHELERALASAGREGWSEHAIVSPGEEAAPAGAPAGEPSGGARLVDEGPVTEPPARPGPVLHHHPAPDVPPIGAPAPFPPRAQGAEFAPSASADAPPVPQPARTAEQAQAGYGESIELAELVRFRDRLDRTLRELAEDYERVIRLRGASEQRSPLDQG